MEKKEIKTAAPTDGDAKNEAFDAKFLRTQRATLPRCVKCFNWGYHHRPSCEFATKEDALHHMEEARAAEKWAREQAANWLQACRMMQGKLAIVKHENNQLRKKVTKHKETHAAHMSKREVLVENWDTAIDKARDGLHKQTVAVWGLENQSDQHKYTLHAFLNNQSNDMEMARRVFNHYIETGNIEYPD